MSADQGAGEDRGGESGGRALPGERPAGRPGFLPPADGRPEQAYPAHEHGAPEHPESEPEPAPPARTTGNGWSAAVLVSSAVLLLSAFLPWVNTSVVVDLFGRSIARDLGTVIGIEADGVVVAVPVLALVAAGMALWGILGRDHRISALSAIPGALSLLVCALFVMRLGDMRDRLAADSVAVGYRVSMVIGWYLAVAASMLIIVCALARPLAARLAAARRERAESATTTD